MGGMESPMGGAAQQWKLEDGVQNTAVSGPTKQASLQIKLVVLVEEDMVRMQH